MRVPGHPRSLVKARSAQLDLYSDAAVAPIHIILAANR